MGAGPSHGELADNDCLLRLAGELEITVDDPFWDTFLTFSLNPPTCRCVRRGFFSVPFLRVFHALRKPSRYESRARDVRDTYTLVERVIV